MTRPRRVASLGGLCKGRHVTQPALAFGSNPRLGRHGQSRGEQASADGDVRRQKWLILFSGHAGGRSRECIRNSERESAEDDPYVLNPGALRGVGR